MSLRKKQRIQQINQMLLEMASGNFFYRLERSAKNDHLEAISISLNMLAEEIQEIIRHDGYVNSNNPMTETIQMGFILDNNGLIEMANQQACVALSVRHADILQNAFDEYLTENSKNLWKNTWQRLQNNEFHDSSLELEFISNKSLVAPQKCFISTFKSVDTSQMKTLITVIQHSKIQDILKSGLKQLITPLSDAKKNITGVHNNNRTKSKPRLSFEDVRKIREGRNIILNNLEQDFPSLRDFALQLGTNEFKLKYGFKELYGTSVHRYLMQERLRKSKMMVQFTDQSLKSIAHATGFKSISHFSRTFKKHYDQSPSDFRKNELKNDSI